MSLDLKLLLNLTHMQKRILMKNVKWHFVRKFKSHFGIFNLPLCANLIFNCIDGKNELKSNKTEI